MSIDVFRNNLSLFPLPTPTTTTTTATMASKALPRVILGTMAMGGQASEELSAQLLSTFQKRGYNEIDTAIMYVGGKTEEVLGKVMSPPSSFSIATKANPWFDGEKTQTTPSQGFKRERVHKQLSLSLKNMGVESVDIFYLHAPDHDTPLSETLGAVNELHQQGKFKLFGLSNFASWQVVHIYHLCKEKGYVLPTVYQGMYNCITRVVEQELLPALKTLGIRFYAYNPLAGGMLTNKHQKGDNPGDGRFNANTVWGQRYRERFWQDAQFESLSLLKEVAAKHELTTTQVALRWLMHHSKLSRDNEDGVILGASNLQHLTENIDSVEAGPLPDEILEATEAAWKGSKPVCPSYFR